MNAADRRIEIISILIARRNVTAEELAEELHVTSRTINNDIQALSFGFPIYTKPGVHGGIFMSENYNPYVNSLTKKELQTLQELYERAESEHKEILLQIIKKYGPNQLQL